MTRGEPKYYALLIALTLGASASLLSVQPTMAQSSAPVPENAPTLAPEQKVLIYQSVSAMHKNSAAPPGFRVEVGAQVPPGVELKPVPDAVAKVIPSIKTMDVGMIEKQVILVDATSRKVLAVVNQAN